MSDSKYEKKAKKTVKKQVKKAVKKNPKGVLIATVAVVLIIAIAVAVLYFGFPEKWDMLMEMISSSQDPDDGRVPLARGDGELQIHFIDVGQGDSILILFPDGKDMLIDCGNSNGGSEYRDSALAYLNTYVTDGQLDYFMLTHSDKDHVSYADEVLAAFKVDTIYMPFILATPTDAEKAAEVEGLPGNLLSKFTDEDTISTGVYADFFIAALSENAEIIFNIGHFFIRDTALTYSLDFYCYSEEDWENTGFGKNENDAEAKNAVSPIGILEYNGKRIVLTGDSNEINEPKFIETIGAEIDCDVLKVGHHGSESSSTDAFLDFIDCEYAVISCNAVGNTHDHPRQDALDRFVERNMDIYRTDLQGTIVLSVDASGALVFHTEKTASATDLKVGADTLAS